ncbi:hypothetical protein chiPu_0030593, partial [Chiloscyllium punctatum]|nr:hypothetical protein [Chiloscyllium punctatum]
RRRRGVDNSRETHVGLFRNSLGRVGPTLAGTRFPEWVTPARGQAATRVGERLWARPSLRVGGLPGGSGEAGGGRLYRDAELGTGTVSITRTPFPDGLRWSAV